MAEMLDSEAAARVLGVKVATVYAYVSRGLLVSHPAPDGRRSLFYQSDIERFLNRDRHTPEEPKVFDNVNQRFTIVSNEGPLYRGQLASELARHSTIEEVADLLWNARSSGEWKPLYLEPPPNLDARDLLRWTVVMTGSQDPIRSDLRSEAIMRAARRLIATMVVVHSSSDRNREGHNLWSEETMGGSVAEMLVRNLSETEATEAVLDAVNAMLIMHADHGLSAASLAVRVIASLRADVYDSVLTGLCAVAAPFHDHDTGTELAYSFLASAERSSVEAAVSDSLRWRGSIPGFGHAVYVDGDPRFEVLYDVFRKLATQKQQDVMGSLVEFVAEHELPGPNANLCMAAIMHALSMPRDGGHRIFAVARSVGWVAHYLEEIENPTMRLAERVPT